MLPLVTIYLALAALVHNAESARILGLFPHNGKSHQMVFNPLLRKLAERGHHVTVVSHFPINNPPANYTDVSMDGIAGPGTESIDMIYFENQATFLKTIGLHKMVKQFSEFQPLADLALNICSKLVKFAPLADALKKEYDVVIVEQFNSDCMLGLAHVYGVKAPMISILSSNLMHWSPGRVGVSYNPSHVPIISADYTEKMTFAQRLENTLLNVIYNVWYRYWIQLEEEAIIEKHFGTQIPDLQDLGKNTTMMLVNTFHSLNGPRPLLPGIVEVGGMHLDHTRKTIPGFIERFINESEHGVVLLSFGSLIKTASIPKYKEQIIISALSKLKQRVIWKYENSDDEGTLEGNILKVKWIPQYELLHHNKILAFVGHGGLLGMTEAISAGKPMLVVPFFGDQPLNGAHAQLIGFGKTLSYEDMTEQSLLDGLNTVLSVEMRTSALQASKIWRDRQNDPLDTAVYWTERVIRWGHKDQLHTIAKDLPLYQYLLLDVAAAVILAIATLLVVLRLILVITLSFVSGGNGKEKLQ